MYQNPQGTVKWSQRSQPAADMFTNHNHLSEAEAAAEVSNTYTANELAQQVPHTPPLSFLFQSLLIPQQDTTTTTVPPTTHTLPFPLLVDRLSTMSLFSVPLYWFPLFLDTFWFVSYFCPFYICYHFLWTFLLPPSSPLVQCYHKHVPINTADQTLTRWLHVFFVFKLSFFLIIHTLKGKRWNTQ